MTLRRICVAAVAAIVLAACGGGDEETADSTTTTAATSTSTSTTSASATTSTETSATSTTSSTSTTTTQPAAGLGVTLEPASIWLTTDSDQVCSPATPAVALLEIAPTPGIDTVRARLVSPGGATTAIDAALTDDGSWRAVIGPFDAKRSSTDTKLAVEVMAGSEGADDEADRLMATAELELLAPVRCGDGTTDRRRPPAAASLQVRSDPADLRFVASGPADCADRPRGIAIEAATSAGIVAVEATATTAGGLDRSRSFSGGPRRWTLRIGPVDAKASMPTETPVTITVTATTELGTQLTEVLLATLLRPEPCDADTTTTTTTTTTGTGGTVAAEDVAIEVRTVPPRAEMFASGSGLCPDGPTTLDVEARTAGDVASVGVEARLASGARATIALAQTQPGLWRGTVGPVGANRNMPDRSDIDLRATATGRDGSTATATARAVLLRPVACAAGATTTTSPVPPGTAAPTTAPPVTSPPSTTTATTTATTTTVPATTTTTSTTIPLAVQARTVPAPAVVYATADGACPDGPTTFDVEARTTGSPTSVGVRVTLATGADVSVPMTDQGGGRWLATLGPIPGRQSMPASSPIRVDVRATDGSGATAVDSTTATLLRPAPC